MNQVKRLLTILLFLLTFATISMAQSNPPLTIREVDGSPRKVNATELVFPNGTLTVSAGKVTFTAATSGTVTSVSVTTANGISGSVATATTTPAITLTLGAITPTTVNGNIFTAGTYTLTGAAGKTLTFSNTLTLAGTDSSTLNVGAGGTLGSNAFTSTAFESTANKDAASGYAGLTAGSLLKTAEFPAFSGDVSTSAGGVTTAIGATKVTSAMLNSDVFSTAHSWGGQQTFTAPVLGTPASGVATNLTGTASGLTAGNVTTNANLTGDVTSVGNATAIATGVIVNADINGSAAIDATKIADGTVTSAEFQFINTLGSNAQAQIDAKSPIASPTFTGTPAAPTAAVDTSTTQLATTAFVINQAYAKLASPTLTGVPAAPTAAVDTSTTQLATTAYVINQAYAKLASPTFTGTPTLPTGTIGTTQSAGNSTTALATTAFVTTADNLKANLAGPTFTGTVTIPTPFTIGAVSMTATGTQLNYLNAATGTTGTTSTNLVYSTSPTLITPALGVATATSINGLIISTTTGTFTLTNAKTLSVSNTLTFTGTDSSSVAFGAGGTVLYTTGSGASLSNVVNSITGTANQVVASGATGAVTLSLPQSIATASTPQFLRMGLNQAADATASLALTQTALGSTSTDGIVLQNTTAAAAGAQQWSPATHKTGAGWKTDATAASRTVDFKDELVPVQGAANPTVAWRLSTQINGAGYNARWAFYDGGTYRQINLAGGVAISDPGIYTDGNYLVLDAKQGANTLYLNLDGGATSNTDLQSGLFKVAGTGTISFNTTSYNTCTALTTTAGVVNCTVSDERVKQNINPFSGRGLGIIRDIQPITFSFKRDTPYFDGRAKLGLSAQNLRNANPLLASSTGNVENLLQPEPLALHAVEIDAIKALDARVEAQQSLINELRARVARLESQR